MPSLDVSGTDSGSLDIDGSGGYEIGAKYLNGDGYTQTVVWARAMPYEFEGVSSSEYQAQLGIGKRWYLYQQDGSTGVNPYLGADVVFIPDTADYPDFDGLALGIAPTVGVSWWLNDTLSLDAAGQVIGSVAYGDDGGLLLFQTHLTVGFTWWPGSPFPRSSYPHNPRW